MKLLIITSIKEDLQTVTHIMDKAGIAVFSVSETIGHKTEQHGFLMDNWFGKSGDGTAALFIFSFTDDAKATHTIDLVKNHNAVSESHFPIRAFVVPVDQSSF